MKALGGSLRNWWQIDQRNVISSWTSREKEESVLWLRPPGFDDDDVEGVALPGSGALMLEGEALPGSGALVLDSTAARPRFVGGT